MLKFCDVCCQIRDLTAGNTQTWEKHEKNQEKIKKNWKSSKTQKFWKNWKSSKTQKFSSFSDFSPIVQIWRFPHRNLHFSRFFWWHQADDVQTMINRRFYYAQLKKWALRKCWVNHRFFWKKSRKIENLQKLNFSWFSNRFSIFLDFCLIFFMFFSSLRDARCQVPDLTAHIAKLQHYHDQEKLKIFKNSKIPLFCRLNIDMLCCRLFCQCFLG